MTRLPQLSGCILFAPPSHAHAIFLHNDFICNGTHSVTGGELRGRGGGGGGGGQAQTEKIPHF